MISDRDVWQAALLIVKRYGDDAMPETGGESRPLFEDSTTSRQWARGGSAS